MTIFEKLLEFIEEPEYRIVLGWVDKKTFAIIDDDKLEIRINIHLLIAYCFVHEYLHYAAPNPAESSNEKLIEKRAGKVIDRLKVSEIKNIANRFLEVFCSEYSKI